MPTPRKPGRVVLCILLLSFASLAFTPGMVHAGAVADVSAAELANYQLLYAVDDGQFDFNDAYTVDNTSFIPTGSFGRVAYYVELGSNWVWVSMDTFNADPTLVGVPKAGTTIVQNGTLVTNLHVETNLGSPVTAGDYNNGIIEFWASNYGGNGGGLYGSDNSKFDWKDSGGSTSSGHGSFQVFSLNDALTLGNCLFGITANGGSGIGDQIPEGSNGSQDWTFGSGTGSYSVRNLEIWVDAPLPETFTWDGAGDGDWTDPQWTGGSPGAYPTLSDFAIVQTNTVTVTGAQQARTLTADSGGVRIGSGASLTLADGGTPISMGSAATLTLNGGTLATTSDSGSGTIASLVVNGQGTINNAGAVSVGTLSDGGSAATFVKQGAGTLSLDNTSGTGVDTVAGTTFRVEGGTLATSGAAPLGGSQHVVLAGGTLSVEGVTNYASGLLAGSHSATNWKTDANPGNLGGSAVGPEGMIRDGRLSDIREVHWGSTHGDDSASGPGNTALIYTGEIYLEVGDWTFVEQNDDYSLLKIDGTTVFDVGTWNDANRGVFNATIDDGSGGAWYDFDVRFENGGGGYGFSGQQNTGAGDSNWDQIGNSDTDPDGICGFRYAAGIITDENALSYIDALDPGDGSLYRYAASIAAIDMTDTDILVTADSGLDAVTTNTANFGVLTLQNGILSTSSAEGGITFTGTTVAGTSVGFDTQVNTTPGPIDGGGSGGSIVKTGSADLILNQPGSGLAGAAFVAREGRLVGVSASNPFGTATLEVNGGEIVLSSPGGNVTYDNAVHVTGSGTLTAGQAGGGVAGPATVTVGSSTNGVTIDAGALTMRSTDGYTLDVAGQLSGGNVRINGGTVALNGGGTAASLTVRSGTASTPGLNITNQMQLGTLKLAASGAAFQVSSSDLLSGDRNITLSGGTVSVQNETEYALNQIRGSLFYNTGTSETPVNLDGGLYEFSDTRVLTGDKAGSILTLTENPAYNVDITTQIYGASDNTTGWSTMFPGYTTASNFVTAFSGLFLAPADGTYRFRGSSDDRSLMYIDLDGDGVFDASDRVGPYAWDSNGYVTLEAGMAYTFMIMSQEFGGNESTNWYVTAPGGSEMRIDPSNASQAGWWASGVGPGTINEVNTHFTVTADTTLEVNSPVAAALGNLTFGGGNLGLAGTAPSVSFGALSGDGSVAAGPELIVRDTLSPGNSIGTITVDGDFAVGDGMVYEWEVGGDGTGYVADLVSITGDLDFEGGWTLEINDLGFHRLVLTDEQFVLFEYGGDLTGFTQPTFNVVTTDPRWDTAGLTVLDTGSALVLTGLLAVPEPSTLAMLLGLGGIALLGCLRRRLRR